MNKLVLLGGFAACLLGFNAAWAASGLSSADESDAVTVPVPIEDLNVKNRILEDTKKKEEQRKERKKFEAKLGRALTDRFPELLDKSYEDGFNIFEYVKTKESCSIHYFSLNSRSFCIIFFLLYSYKGYLPQNFYFPFCRGW